jgi:hypothetical protein
MPSYRTVSISELTPGSVLVTPVLDEHLVKLLDAGAIVDRHLIDRLKALGITEVVVESSAETIVSPPQKHFPTRVHERLKGNTARPIRVEHCSVCGTLIALLPPAPNFKASAWYCTTCGAVYFGSDDGGSERRGVFRVDPAVQNPFVAGVAPSIPPENVQRLVKSLVRDEYTGPDRRRHKRYPIVVPVVALPLASDFRINGEPVQMTTANVSLGGAALIHTRFVDTPYLALDFKAATIESLQVVLKVLRVRSLGPVYEVSGEFISRLSQIPT